MRIKEHRIVGKYIADQCCKFTKAASRSAFMTGAALPSNKSRSIKNCLEQTLKYLDILTEKSAANGKSEITTTQAGLSTSYPKAFRG